jgi:hypothetical protein
MALKGFKLMLIEITAIKTLLIHICDFKAAHRKRLERDIAVNFNHNHTHLNIKD